jgi:hypothetical protein
MILICVAVACYAIGSAMLDDPSRPTRRTAIGGERASARAPSRLQLHLPACSAMSRITDRVSRPVGRRRRGHRSASDHYQACELQKANSLAAVAVACSFACIAQSPVRPTGAAAWFRETYQTEDAPHCDRLRHGV